MKQSRRLTLQLTPLLDLLLIVIFAQFLEVREQQVAEGLSAAAAIEEKDAALARLFEVEDRLEALRQDLTESDLRAARSVADADRRARELNVAHQELDRALAQHRVLGELVVELFQIPAEDVARILNPRNRSSSTQTPEDLEQLKRRFEQLAMRQSGRMIEHLLSYEEIRKRCDVWNLHVDEKSICTWETDENEHPVRIPFDLKGNVDQGRLLKDMYNLYRSLPQPRSLVILLLSYDRTSKISVTQAMRDILPRLVEQMQADYPGHIRFEYADLGFRLETSEAESVSQGEQP